MNISTRLPRAHMVWIMRITQCQQSIPYGKGLIYILYACTASGWMDYIPTAAELMADVCTINDRRQKKKQFSQFLLLLRDNFSIILGGFSC